ncbi:MAG: nucleotidyltransferase family protein [Methylococcales bacterium]|nr:nucleotidyltransferase family protein [Methylococcales bacterium]
MKPTTAYTTLVLAADRGPGDPVARHTHAPCKALAPIAGQPMLMRVLDALTASPWIGSIVLSGPPQSVLDQAPELTRLIAAQTCQWLPNQASPCQSVAAALTQLPGQQPVFVTTADHALLSPAMIDAFLSQAAHNPADVAVGLVDYQHIQSAFPDAKRTVLRFRDAGYCGCNLFAFHNLEAASKVVALWQQAEQLRKQPLKLAWRILGPGLLLRYALRQLTLAAALDSLAQRLSVTIKPVYLHDPLAAVDVDKVADLELVEALLAADAGPRSRSA